MSVTDLPTETTRPTAAQGGLLPVLTGAIFLSAALLFAVQPMFTKMVLPRLGGAPQVWSVAMVFFQAALLAGYGYAHALIRLYDQTWLWTIGFYVLILLIAGSGFLLWRYLDEAPAGARVDTTAGAPAPTWGDALSWVGLAAVPSGLLVAVTAHISTDV